MEIKHEPSLGEILFGARASGAPSPHAELSAAFSAWYWRSRAQTRSQRDERTNPDRRSVDTVGPSPNRP